MFVFKQKWFYSVKSGCNRANVVVYRKIGFIPAKCLYIFKVVVFGQKRFYSEKDSVLVQKWLYSVKIGCIRENWLYR